MAAIVELIRRLLYPEDAVCLSCGALRVDDAAFGLCAACSAHMEPLPQPMCPRCGLPGWAMECPACMQKPPDALDARIAAFPFDGPVRELIHALKYDCVLPAASGLAAVMAQYIPATPFDAIVPVPLYKNRLRTRGFNQAEALAAALSTHCGIPVKPLLRRTRNTKTQTALSTEGRHSNVQGAFEAVTPFSERRILLVDDVLTTGATALACAEALKAAGAAQVILLAAARAFNPAESSFIS